MPNFFPLQLPHQHDLKAVSVFPNKLQQQFLLSIAKAKKNPLKSTNLPSGDGELLFTLLAVCCFIILQPGMTLENRNENLIVEIDIQTEIEGQYTNFVGFKSHGEI